MKKILLFISLSILYACEESEKEESNMDIIEYEQTERPADSYNYTAEWRELESGVERWNACQIDKKQAASMSSEALAQSIIEFPLLIDYITYDSYPNYDIQGLPISLNSYDELISRNDAGFVLSKYYWSFPLVYSGNNAIIVSELYSFICAQQSAIAKYSERDSKVILKKVLENLEIFDVDGSTYYFLAAKVLDKYGKFSNDEIKIKIDLKNESVFFSSDEKKLIIDKVKEFIK